MAGLVFEELTDAQVDFIVRYRETSGGVPFTDQTLAYLDQNAEAIKSIAAQIGVDPLLVAVSIAEEQEDINSSIGNAIKDVGLDNYADFA